MNIHGSEKFSNAGIKINLALSIPEIGSLFGWLYDAKLISNTKENGDKFTKLDMASFISKNFTTNRFSPISANSLKAHFSSSNTFIEIRIEKLLMELASGKAAKH